MRRNSGLQLFLDEGHRKDSSGKTPINVDGNNENNKTGFDVCNIVNLAHVCYVLGTHKFLQYERGAE